MKLATVVLKDLELLPHFLAHYKGLGVSQFLIGVYEDTGVMGRVREICREYPHAIFPIRGWFDARKDIRVCHEMCRRFVGRNEWWIIADLDEFHEFPLPLPRLVSELEEGGYTYLQSRLLDRVTSDGSCPPIRVDIPLWDQFPAAAYITRKLMRAKVKKVLLVRGHAKVEPGHHAGRRKGSGRTFFGGIVHHFKWYGNIGEKIRERRQSIIMRRRGFQGKCDRFLRFWKKRHRLPIAGEFGFHFPRKPIDWPEPKSCRNHVSGRRIPAGEFEHAANREGRRRSQPSEIHRNTELFDCLNRNKGALNDASFLSSMLAPLCLNSCSDSKCNRLHLQQAPAEFAQFLIFMAQHGIRSYLEVGTGGGGSLFTVDSYLRAAVERFQGSFGIDCREHPMELNRYRSRFPTCMFEEVSSDDYKPEQFYDMTFLDAAHAEASVWTAFEKV